MAEPNPKAPMLPFGKGVEWFFMGLGLVRAQPWRLLVLGLLLQLLAGLTQYSIFGLIFFLCLPAFSVGMLEAVRHVHAGGRPPVTALFAAFGHPDRLPRLLVLGTLMLIAVVFSVGFAMAGAVANLDPLLLQRLESGDPNAVMELDPAILTRTLYGMVIGMFLGAGITYFGAPLIFFRGNGLGQALVDGLVALIRQWKPLLVMGLLLGLLSIPPAILTVLTASHVALGESPPWFLSLPTMAVVVVFQVLVFATQYASYVEVFGVPGGSGGTRPEDGDDAEAEDRDDQLVA